MQQSAALHALLVGINTYISPQEVPSLQGCLQDVQQMEHFLLTQQSFFSQFHLSKLENEAATKQAVVAAFEKILTQAEAGDTLLFYFSGHGTQEEADPVFHSSESDKKLECLVCYDSIQMKRGRYETRLLADKELRYLIHQLAQQDLHIVTIFDCCHSGDNTRNSYLYQRENIRERQVFPKDSRLSYAFPKRLWQEFLFGETISKKKLETISLQDMLPEGRHIHLSACQSNESAYERDGSGVFTEALLHVLQSSNGEVSYRNLHSRIQNFLRNRFNQHPRLYVPRHAQDDIFLIFLNREDTSPGKPAYHNVLYNVEAGGWVLAIGAIDGVSHQMENVQVKTFDGLKNWTAAIEKIETDYTLLNLPNPQPDTNQLLKGYIKDFFASAIPVCFRAEPGAEEGLQFLHQAFQPPLRNINFVEEETGEGYTVHALQGRYDIMPFGQAAWPLVATVRGYSKESAEKIRFYLRHIAQWEYVKELHNPNATHFRSVPVQVQFLQKGENNNWTEIPAAGSDIRMNYSLDGNKQPSGDIKIRVTNTFAQPVYCALLYLSMNFEVYTQLLAEQVKYLEPQEEIWAYEGEAIPLSYEPQVREFNYPESVSYFKLIVSTTPFDVLNLAQDALPEPSGYRSGNANTKGIVTRKESNVKAKDWNTELFALRLRNPFYRHDPL